MKGKRAEFLIDFKKLKKQKQKRMDENFADLYDWMFTYVQKEANLREKVRAKHLFRHKLDLNDTDELDAGLHLHFEHWLLFDYVTVVGSRLLDLFVRTKQDKMSKTMLEICGILMVMHLEPVRVNKIEENHILLSPFFKEKNSQIKAEPYLFRPDIKEGDLILARTATIGFEKRIIGPCIVIDQRFEKEAAARLEEKYKEGHEEYRRYLKEYGIDMLKYQKVR
ncbi:hypothetical protein K8O68_03155 [Salipaludibacillus sp. CUR1]|uniref:hypothetical protein n=1 Tax=Salipaludibacillus sp. CUR1 TaxID=2820003 RepID=UPI001E54C6A0|nr:hypothetical protein [Salipaludibacillus sp. CUR1]MCE7791421.1 hypothetical protein [Salipaludibacillus sp. CUR1]